jgi:hypothetical protein
MFLSRWEHLTRGVAVGSKAQSAGITVLCTGARACPRHFAAGHRTFSAWSGLICKGAAMTQADHYRDQSNRAKRLAQAVNDPETSKKLAEMAEEFRLYAERLEQTH